MHSTIDLAVDLGAAPTGPPVTDGAPHALPPAVEVHPGMGDLERAVPGIKARLEARYDELDPAVVEAAVTRAINATATFRLQEFRVILVERQADRDLRKLRQQRAHAPQLEPIPRGDDRSPT